MHWHEKLIVQCKRTKWYLNKLDQFLLQNIDFIYKTATILVVTQHLFIKYMFLLCSFICNFGVTLAVLFLYPVTTKDTCIFILSLFSNCYCFMYLEVLNK